MYIYIYTRIESPINPDLLNCHLVCMCCSTSWITLSQQVWAAEKA